MIDFAKPVQTRDGRKVRILCTDRKPEPGGHTVIGLVTSGGIEWTYAWPSSGQYTDKPGPDDLINTPPHVEVPTE